MLFSVDFPRCLWYQFIIYPSQFQHETLCMFACPVSTWALNEQSSWSYIILAAKILFDNVDSTLRTDVICW